MATSETFKVHFFFGCFFFSICMPLVQDYANTVSTAYLKEIRTMLQSKSTSLVEGTQVASGMMLKELAGYAEARICCRDFFGVYKLQYLHLYSYKCTYIYIHVYVCECYVIMYFFNICMHTDIHDSYVHIFYLYVDTCMYHEFDTLF